jgi:hypothetical protein
MRPLCSVSICRSLSKFSSGIVLHLCFSLIACEVIVRNRVELKYDPIALEYGVLHTLSWCAALVIQGLTVAPIHRPLNAEEVSRARKEAAANEQAAPPAAETQPEPVPQGTLLAGSLWLGFANVARYDPVFPRSTARAKIWVPS